MASYETLSLKEKVAIVTGSSSGIGAATAVLLAARGAQVVISGREADNLQKTETACQQASPDKLKPLLILGDITKREVRQELIDRTVKDFGRIDVLVNNAGFVRRGGITTATLEDLDAMYDIHVRCPFDLISLALPHLIASKGNVVNVSSVASIRSGSGSLPYGVAKAAMDQLTKCSAMDLGPKGVLVNSVNPGPVETGFHKNIIGTTEDSKAFWDKMIPMVAMDRVGKPCEVAEVIAFLSSNAAAFMTGSIVLVDGGAAPLLRIPKN